MCILSLYVLSSNPVLSTLSPHISIEFVASRLNTQLKTSYIGHGFPNLCWIQEKKCGQDSGMNNKALSRLERLWCNIDCLMPAPWLYHLSFCWNFEDINYSYNKMIIFYCIDTASDYTSTYLCSLGEFSLSKAYRNFKLHLYVIWCPSGSVGFPQA